MPTWLHRPTPKAYDLPREEAPAASNPVVRGWALYYGAQL